MSLRDAIDNIHANRDVSFGYAIGEVLRALSEWAREQGCLFDPLILEDDIVEMDVAFEEREVLWEALDATDTKDALDAITKLQKIAKDAENNPPAKPARKPRAKKEKL